MKLWMRSTKRSRTPVPSPQEVIDRLKLGRQRLIEAGWYPRATRCVSGGKVRSYCMLGALIDWDRTLGDGCKGHETHIYGKAVEALCKTLGLKSQLELIKFNSEKGRTKQEVLQAYDRTIERCSEALD